MKKEFIYLISICGLLLLSILNSCYEKNDSIIMTVNGSIPADSAGLTLTHEHLMVDFIGADSTGYHRWNKDSVIRRVLPFLQELRQYGVNTIMECTPSFLGRDPLLLKRLSEETGLQILTNTGYYGASSNKYVPAKIDTLSAQQIADLWIREFEHGIEDTGIKPGFIKISVDPDDNLSETHKKLVTAAIITHKHTGMVIASHTGPETPAFAQIELLKNNQVPLSAFIWVHAQRGNIEANVEAAKMGVWISLDNVNKKKDKKPGAIYGTEWYADRLLRMKQEALLHRVLLSHDAGWYSPGEENGGDFRGFTDIFTDLLPAIRERGFTEDEINQILVENPSEAFRLRK